MKRYFVKAIFSGWCEVDEENFKAFVKHLRKGVTAMSGERKEEYIKTKIKIIEE